MSSRLAYFAWSRFSTTTCAAHPDIGAASLATILPWPWARARDALAADEPVFDIPAQPLDTALEAFARASGVDVLYDKSLTEKRLSSQVRGHMTQLEALGQLLSATGLTARFVRANAVLIVAAHGRASAESTDPSPVLMRLETLDVRAHATRCEPLEGEGADTAMVQAELQGFVVTDPPPADMPRPLRVEVLFSGDDGTPVALLGLDRANLFVTDGHWAEMSTFQRMCVAIRSGSSPPVPVPRAATGRGRSALHPRRARAPADTTPGHVATLATGTAAAVAQGRRQVDITCPTQH